MLRKVKTRHDFNMYIDPEYDGGIERSIYNIGTYEIGTLDVISNCLTAGDTFIDIGANIGLMSLVALKAVGSAGIVISFEAVKNTFKILGMNIQKQEYTNSLKFNLALSNSSGIKPIYTVPHNRGGASLTTFKDYFIKHGIYPPNWEGTKELCNVTTLDTWNKINPIKKIDMIKIDVDGSELDVLMGGKETINFHHPIICIEYACIEIINFLSELDYLFYKLPRTKFNIDNLILIEDYSKINNVNGTDIVDNIFCFQRCHLEGNNCIKNLKIKRGFLYDRQ